MGSLLWIFQTENAVIKVKPGNECCVTRPESEGLGGGHSLSELQTLNTEHTRQQECCLGQVASVCLSDSVSIRTPADAVLCASIVFYPFMPLQAMFRKAVVLFEMGQVDKSLHVFLHCLALDESFPCAKRHVEKVRADTSTTLDGLSEHTHTHTRARL